MRDNTRKAYEKRIEALETGLLEANRRENKASANAEMWEKKHRRLRDSRVVGERDRQWAIDQALRTSHPDVVKIAKQIADYVYGPDYTADRPEETG